MMECGTLTIRGKVRMSDEDSVFCARIYSMEEDIDNSITFGMVADGMGGGEKGEIASKYTVQVFAKNINEMVIRGDLSSEKIKEVMMKSVTEANDLVSNYARGHDIKMMGTTVTAAVVKADTMFVINIGDSRTYLISKDGNVKKKTKDHSYVQELVDNGFLDESEVRTHPQRNIVTRVVDGTKDAVPDFYQWKIYSGDTVVMCCDGLWGPLDDRVISKTVSSEGNIQEKARLLVETANELDGSDNISVVILRQLNGEKEENFISLSTKKKKLEASGVVYND
ncbi:MAG: protein phosphatase 2C domain-containing protein [Candidatus Micrarchaeaceae archaeon]